MKLRDCLPPEFFGEYMDSSAAKHLDVDVVETIKNYDKSWPGQHKNIIKWWKLSNGYAVGWNENVSRGWSFPVIKY